GDAADPPVLLLIHGWLGSAQSDFADLLPWLSRRFRVIGPTRRGYGESSPKPRDYPVDFLRRDARDLIALLDALGVLECHVLGWSDGGETGLCVAGLAGARVRSCAVWGATGYYAPSLRDATASTYPPVWMDAATKARNHLTDADADQLVLGWVTAVRQIVDGGGDAALSLAPQISAPVLMMLGKQDRLNPASSAEHFLKHVADGGLVMFDGGHALHWEEPDKFKRVLAAFWDHELHRGR
ncbi:MAG: alpha/beta hydrolase, partial [Anaerolinea sp.]|nr:alpha/beta hydrolase [Anaerolinea sp.]